MRIWAQENRERHRERDEKGALQGWRGENTLPTAQGSGHHPLSPQHPARHTPAAPYLHSDLVLPSGHALQPIVMAAAAAALHRHAAGHQLLGHSAHELHVQGHHHLPRLAGGTSIHVYP